MKTLFCLFDNPISLSNSVILGVGLSIWLTIGKTSVFETKHYYTLYLKIISFQKFDLFTQVFQKLYAILSILTPLQ